ncbi:F0F1 ATP synthase subunit delta [Staphylococcus carnosus]|uniref:F0F1 ATP synthase subunit delta n=1 Tax=Staphylococcus carnosus TaxID=1281 RepID=UPI000CD13DD2|nr:F0F1 ATP synthase subunit delta [Staphylococcus carnosus]POA02138.1 F0F1 ATP synthase subunit delta [Staphylococcus carnosus]QRQ04701.1 F0F1 ATP synthase subunit delta [Staphylococcus carnosus]UTB83301.1 ATP synthase F1 subunit delta [Staphylococcus carnosus]SUM05679.1 F0F1 ATP synthase subunit delta [Staphylococcus carnosus]GEP79845.1 ATP synthase subunit delta [Staphylococcus carnosus]
MAIIAKKYAQALYETSLDKDVLDLMYDEFAAVDEAVIPNQDKLKAFDSDPKNIAEDRNSLVESAFKGINEYLKNMLFVMAENRHLSILPEVFKAFEGLYNQYYNQDFATVESVHKLSQDELDKVGEALIQRTGLSKLIITNVINKSLIGGIRAKVGTKVFDGSIQNDLAQIERKFIRTK